MSNIKLSYAEAITENYRLRLDGFYLKSWEAYAMPDFHKHERVEFMFVEEGECSIFVLNDKKGQTECVKHVLSKGEGILIDYNVWHRLVVDGKCRIVNLEFILTQSKDSASTVKEITYLSPIVAVFLRKFKDYVCFFDRSGVRKAARNLLEESSSSSEYPDSENICSLYASLLLVEIARSQNKVVQSQPYEIHVKRAIEYIDTHVKEKITCEDIAKHVKVNYAYLERLFKKRMNMTLGEYVNLQKINMSEALLVNTTMPIANIAEQVGFGTRQQYNNAFKRLRGVSPQKYRQDFYGRKSDIWYGFTGDYGFELMNDSKHLEEE